MSEPRNPNPWLTVALGLQTAILGGGAVIGSSQLNSIEHRITTLEVQMQYCAPAPLARPPTARRS